MTEAGGIVGMMSRGWNQAPAGLVMAAQEPVARAVLWRHSPVGAEEVIAEPLPAHNILTVHQRTVRADTFLDGRHVCGPVQPRATVQLVRAGVRPRAVLSSPYELLHVYVPDASIRDVADQLGTSGAAGSVELRDPALAEDGPLFRLSLEILAEMRSDDHLSRLRVDVLTQDIAIQLVRRWSNLELRRAPERGGLAPWQIKRVTEYMEADIARNVTLAELSAIAGLSSCHFCRAFKQSLGLAPHQWLRARRMEKARELLETTDLPMIEVGALVGLESPSTFATAFRKLVGTSPSAYRRDRRW